jgi:hypothetical protein
LGLISIATLALILFFVSFNKSGIVSLCSVPDNEEPSNVKKLDIQELNSETYTPNKELETLQKPSVTLFFVSFNSFNKLQINPFDRVLSEELNDTKKLDVQGMNTGTFTFEENITKVFSSSYYSEAYTLNKKLEIHQKLSVSQQYRLYKEDQLLSNPGGDNFFLNRTSGVIDNDYDHSKFSRRVGKDLADAGSNLLNMVKDMGIGAKIRYIDNHGEIREERKVGFVATLGNFFKNIISGLTLGAYTPEGEIKPHGGADRTKHLFKKIFRDAIVGDIVMGVSRSMIYVGEDMILAGLNSIEVIPDATIGNFEAGRKVTTSIFDNTQVVVDFMTDVLPGGEASGRTRSFRLARGFKGLPIINNITTDEKGAVELNWRYVRNTNFRKVIETVTSLFPASI